MPFQIAFEWSVECEKELQEKGFKKREVYMRSFPGAIGSVEGCKQGDSDFFSMKHKPFQFVTTSHWGAGPD